ncbi:MAG: hypothetical protein HYR96_07375 [Deltaproteobacteria bacterium]|nr:hypothetical protein [Deltaproteobacteria bacterium]MBI3294199.1 hypothetical protein [Deltaproteobacteria bacterium]
MSLQKILITVHDNLERENIEHALIGGLGLASLGIQRATFDVDLLVDGKDKARISQLMTSLGWQIAMETSEVLHFSGNGRVDFLLANRPLGLEMLSLAKPGALGIRVVGPEGIIGLKIQAYKNSPRRELQDKADILSLMEKFPKLDWKRVKEYADLFDEWQEIERIKNTL